MNYLKQLILIFILIQTLNGQCTNLSTQTAFNACISGLNGSDLSLITSLTITSSYSNSAITDISAIKGVLLQCSNLLTSVSIKLSNTSVSPLQSSISDLALGIQSHAQLTYLSINFEKNSQISDVTPILNTLSTFVNLDSLLLNFLQTSISSIAGIENVNKMTLLTTNLSLQLGKTLVTDISPLQTAFNSQVSLKKITLDISGLNFSSYTIGGCFKFLTSLESLYLYIEENYASDMSLVGKALENDTVGYIKFLFSQVNGDNSYFKDIFTSSYIPNVETLDVTFKNSNIDQLSDIFDSVTSSPEKINLNFHCYQWPSPSGQLDFSNWSNSLDTLTLTTSLTIYFHIQFIQVTGLNNLTQVSVNKLKQLEVLSISPKNGSNLVMDVTKFELPNLKDFFVNMLFIDGNKQIDMLKNEDLFLGCPSLTKVVIWFNLKSLVLSQMTDWVKFYKGLGTQQLANFDLYTFASEAPAEFINVQPMINPYSKLNVKSFMFNMQGRNSDGFVKSLDYLQDFLNSIIDETEITSLNLLFNDNQISDLTVNNGLQLRFNTYGNLNGIWFDLEGNLFSDISPLVGIFNFDWETQKIPAGINFDIAKDNTITSYLPMQEILEQMVYYGKVRQSYTAHYLNDLNGLGYQLNQQGIKGDYLSVSTTTYCKSNYALAKWYDSGVSQCLDCINSQCHLCVNATECSKCRYSRTVARELPLCGCPIGYMDQVISSSYFLYDCEACNWGCKTCSGNLSCDSCLASATVARVMPQCGCPGGYFDDLTNADCVECNYFGCDTCSDSTSCDICKVSSTIARVMPECGCPDGYFDDLTNADCVECNYFGCDTCSDSTSCDICKISSTVTRVMPQCGCPGGYFDDLTNNDCVQCTYFGCDTCSNSTSCDVCKISSTVARIMPQCGCPSGYYDDLTNADCVKCAYFGCDTCSNATQCDVCKISSTVARIGSDCSCPVGYFDDQISNDCQKCPDNCVSCSDLLTCISCSASASPARETNNTCQCPEGYFDNGLDTQCQKCLNSCLNCSNASECDICKISIPERIGNTCQCPVDYSDDGINGQCFQDMQCDQKCQSCIGTPNNCIACAIGNFRTLELPLCGCMEGFYQENDEDLHCKECSSKCKSCENNKNTCLECANSQFRPPLCRGRSQGFFSVVDKDQIIVENCPVNCETCDNKGNCDECSGYNRGLNKNLECVCEAGFHDENQILPNCSEKCSENCLVCISSTQCNKCVEGLNREMNQFTNQCDCVLGYKENQYTHKCEVCYQLDDECLFKCPENYAQNEKTFQCEAIQYLFQDNIVFIIIVSSVLLATIFLTFKFIQSLINRKFKYFNRESIVQNQNQQESNRIMNQDVSLQLKDEEGCQIVNLE